MNTRYEDLLGRGLVGFPGSVITKVTPSLDYLMNGPLHGEALGTITVVLQDGRTVVIARDIFRVQTYERKP